MMSKFRGIMRFACRSSLLSLTLLAACETIHNADVAKMEVLPAAVAHSTKQMERVNLAGYELADLVCFALTNRPDVISAELAETAPTLPANVSLPAAAL